jgi:hypothetical protein
VLPDIKMGNWPKYPQKLAKIGQLKIKIFLVFGWNKLDKKIKLDLKLDANWPLRKIIFLVTIVWNLPKIHKMCFWLWNFSPGQHLLKLANKLAIWQPCKYFSFEVLINLLEKEGIIRASSASSEFWAVWPDLAIAWAKSANLTFHFDFRRAWK